jgi:hypothetical protein
VYLIYTVVLLFYPKIERNLSLSRIGKDEYMYVSLVLFVLDKRPRVSAME